jgi:hypothetical protein
MNKRQIIASLNDIANELDDTGLHNEASRLTQVMVKLSQAEMPENELPEDAEAQQGGIEGFFNSVGDRLFGAPKYPGTPQQKANFMKATVDVDPAIKDRILRVAKPLTPAQKKLMSEAPVEVMGIRFPSTQEFGEIIGFYYPVVMAGNQKYISQFFDDKALFYQLSKPAVKFPESSYGIHDAVEGGQNPYPAIKTFILSNPLPKATPQALVYWFQNSKLISKENNQPLFTYRTTDGRAIKEDTDLRFIESVEINRNAIVRASQILARQDPIKNRAPDYDYDKPRLSGPYHTNTGELMPALRSEKPLQTYNTKANYKDNITKFVLDPDIIEYVTNLNTIILSVKSEINKKDPSFGENVRTLVQRNIFRDRR